MVPLVKDLPSYIIKDTKHTFQAVQSVQFNKFIFTMNFKPLYTVDKNLQPGNVYYCFGPIGWVGALSLNNVKFPFMVSIFTA